MESIDFLTSTVQKLETVFRFWHYWSNWLIILAISAGACLYFFQYRANENAIWLNEAKDKLNELKMEKAKKEAEGKIAQVKAEAEINIAKVKANSEEKIAQARADADKQIALLNAETNKSKEQIAKAHAEAAQANERTEKERIRRLELQKKLSPRSFPILMGGPRNRTNVDPLKRFAGTKVVLYSLGDAEPLTLTRQISQALSIADWDVVNRIFEVNWAFPGIAIFTESEQQLVDPEHVRVLMSLFRKYNLDARVIPSKSIAKKELLYADKFPGALKISIGVKPGSDPNAEVQSEERSRWMEEFMKQDE